MNKKVQMSVTFRKLRNGNDGKQGQSVFKTTVFKRFAPGTAITAPIGGNYDNPVPTGWSDGIPAEDGNPCYCSMRVFTNDGRSPQWASWSYPMLMSDTTNYDVCYSSKATWPSAPTTHGTQNDSVWHEVATTNDRWMAQSWCRNGVWSAWTITKIKGEDGASATIQGTAIAHYSSMTEFENNYGDFGVYLVDDGSQPKTLTVGSTITSQNANIGDGWFIGGDLWVCTQSDGWKNAGNFKGPEGPKGDNAKYVVVTAEQAFVYKDDFTGTPSPTSIVISAALYGGLTTRAWSYKRSDQSSFSTISGQTGATLTVSPTAAAYWGTANTVRSCTFRCTSNGYYDEITIAKVSSGKNGDDSYTVLLTNECHTFSGENNHALAGSAECGVIAYKGNNPIVPHIGEITGQVNGLTTAISGNDTVDAKFTVSVSTALTQKSGTLNVPITVDGKTFVKVFSWSLSLKGNTGSGTEGRSAFEVSVTPLTFNANENGLVIDNDGGSPLNIAYITAKYKNTAAFVTFQYIVSVQNCQAAQSSYNISSAESPVKIGVAISNIATKKYSDSGVLIEGSGAAAYNVPATSGYAVVRVNLTVTTNTSISETKDVVVPWTVNVDAHFAKFYHDEREFYSTISSIQDDVNGLTTSVSTIQQKADQISLKVGQLSQDKRNLILQSYLNLVDYRHNMGERKVRLTANRTYLLSVKAIASPALVASNRRMSLNGIATTKGCLRTAITDANGAESAYIIFRNSEYYDVGFTFIRPTATKDFVIVHSDYPNSVETAKYQQGYHVEWEQLEDITDILPDNWSGLSATEKLAVLPNLATPWSLAEGERESNTNLLNGLTPQYDSAYYTPERVTLPNGEVVDGFYLHQTSNISAAQARDVSFVLVNGLVADKTYTLSFWAKGVSVNADQNIISALNNIANSSVSPVLGVGSLTAYSVESVTKLYLCYPTLGGVGTVVTRIGTEWRRYAISFTLARAASLANPIRVIAGRAADYQYHIAGIKLEEGGRATYGDSEALYATGIDITKRKLSLTADNIEFRDNQGNFAALIRGEGITAYSFIALNSSGVKISSMNESGDGAFVQYYSDGVTPKFVFGNDGITCYNEDSSIKWFIGVGGVNGTTDDWIPYDKYEVVDEEHGIISNTCQTKYLFRCGTSSANSRFDGLFFASQNLNSSKLDGKWANSTTYNMLPTPMSGPDIYFRPNGQTSMTKVYYIRSYAVYANGKAGRTYGFYYDSQKNYVGTDNPDGPHYGSIIVNV